MTFDDQKRLERRQREAAARQLSANQQPKPNMREITTHRVNPANDTLKIIVTDEPGAGGAFHRYEITGFNTAKNLSCHVCSGFLEILFQNGPIAEAGVNGVTQEALLAIVRDRLECFQAGPYASEYNGKALEHIDQALEYLKARTRERMARGVEGTHQK